MTKTEPWFESSEAGVMNVWKLTSIKKTLGKALKSVIVKLQLENKNNSVFSDYSDYRQNITPKSARFLPSRHFCFFMIKIAPLWFQNHQDNVQLCLSNQRFSRICGKKWTSSGAYIKVKVEVSSILYELS